MMRVFSLILAFVAATLLLSGCATKTYVQEELATVQSRIDGVEGQVEENQTRLGEHDQQIDELSKTAQDALQRAIDAGKLAEGKLLFETVLSDDKVRFGFDKAELTPEAMAALDAFAAPLVDANQNIYIEIQGHTDGIGSEEYNYELGLARAEAVRRYLSSSHGFPLHRISVISYGESEPIADNNTREGRSQNRRVVLVVLT
jgi:outer membrane protein OmpA-like peptidoglycan-associated protein